MSPASRTRIWSGSPGGGSPGQGGGSGAQQEGGQQGGQGETLLTIYADNEQKMQDALAVAIKLEPVIIEGMVLARIPSFTRMSR